MLFILEGKTILLASIPFLPGGGWVGGGAGKAPRSATRLPSFGPDFLGLDTPLLLLPM